ncbi:hypothetical protein AKJ09_03604 [Labilithrix luteola]|uniref:Signal peptidase I n=1 Tax=Labilithrix luteola TaxID=1391654 RepID=A0A0K1PTT1_9BACT|nr:signal peptidase I [Labilithrix luteola]AKU96940.1 hypothetical protein AKJ09_03604 [Labilithrix luteola]
MESFVRGAWWIVAILGAIGLLLYLFVVDTWVVPGTDTSFAASIQPTLKPGDRILVQRGSVPRVGQLARCLHPLASETYVVGRVFGEGRDRVEMRNESVSVNGKPVATRHGCPSERVVHPVSGQETELTCVVEENGAFTYSALVNRDYPEGGGASTVESGKLYLVSDNRHLHQDSRDYGLVDASTCEHVLYRLWGDTYADGSRRFTVLW